MTVPHTDNPKLQKYGMAINVRQCLTNAIASIITPIKTRQRIQSRMPKVRRIASALKSHLDPLKIRDDPHPTVPRKPSNSIVIAYAIAVHKPVYFPLSMIVRIRWIVRCGKMYRIARNSKEILKIARISYKNCTNMVMINLNTVSISNTRIDNTCRSTCNFFDTNGRDLYLIFCTQYYLRHICFIHLVIGCCVAVFG